MPVPLPVPDRAAALARLTDPPVARRPLYRSHDGDPAARGDAVVDGVDPGGADPGGAGAHRSAPLGDEPVRAVRRRRPDPGRHDGGTWHRSLLDRWTGPAGAGAGRATPVLVAGIVVLLVVAVALAWPMLRRPAEADAALPRAGSDPVTAGAAPSAGDGSPATTADAAASTSAGPSPGAATTTAPSASVTVHVAGAVASPGVVSLPAGNRVVDAVAAAGGLRPDADSDRVNLAAKLTDGQRIVIPLVGQPVPSEVAPAGDGGGALHDAGGGNGGGPAGGVPAEPVDLNSATAEELDALPGVGPATAAAILDQREQAGPFRSVEDLLDVRGIGEAKLDALRDLVVVGG